MFYRPWNLIITQNRKMLGVYLKLGMCMSMRVHGMYLKELIIDLIKKDLSCSIRCLHIALSSLAAGVEIVHKWLERKGNCGKKVERKVLKGNK